MRFTSIVLLVLLSGFLKAQENLVLDTITRTYSVQGFNDFTSTIPQIKEGSNPVARELINADILQYFRATQSHDSLVYLDKRLQNLDNETLNDTEETASDDEQEAFQIPYLSENLLSFIYTYQVLPAGGRYQFFFESAHYDLRTGKNLLLQDFLAISKEELIDILKLKGYRIEPQSTADRPFSITPVDAHDEYLEINIPDLFTEDGLCADFYFIEDAGDLHLRIAMKCAGPYIAEYGISMVHLREWIQYSEFKNRYHLWGKDVYTIVGMDYWKLGNEVYFQDYAMVNTGSGYLISDAESNGLDHYGIVFCHSTKSMFYLFLHHQTIEGKKVATVLDVLEVDRGYFKKCKMAEFCDVYDFESDAVYELKSDDEIMALVKDQPGNPEYYTKVRKAWRANRLSGKFEPVNRKIVKLCVNESFGL